MNTFFFGGGFEIVFFIIFAVVLIIFIVTAARGIGQWHKNNNSPRLTVPAAVVSKRTQVTRQNHSHDAEPMMHTTSTTWYYATFQVESGDRMELSVSGSEYGMLAEGDTGNLSFQGTRFLDFERQ